MHTLNEIIKKKNINHNLNTIVRLTSIKYSPQKNMIYLTAIGSLNDKAEALRLLNLLLEEFSLEVDYQTTESIDQISPELIFKILNNHPTLSKHSSCIKQENIDIQSDVIRLEFSIQQMLDSFMDEKYDILLQELITNEYKTEMTVECIKTGFVDNENYLKTIQQTSKKKAKQALNIIKDKKSEISDEDVPIFKKGKDITSNALKIIDVQSDEGTVVIEGEIIDIRSQYTKTEKFLLIMDIADDTSAIKAKTWLTEDEYKKIGSYFKKGVYLRIKGKVAYDTFERCNSITFNTFIEIQKPIRPDTSIEKRVELHMYSQMSTLNGLVDIKKVTKILNRWGHTAFGITDQGSVQSYPELYQYAKDNNLKPLFGLEIKLLEDQMDIIIEPDDTLNFHEFTVFDIETTGLSNIRDEITEIGAVKIINGKIVDTYNQLINPGKPIPEEITKLTGITNEMVKNKPFIDEVLPEFLKFVGSSTLVAHNARFDMGFIRKKSILLNMDYIKGYIDTLGFARSLFPELKNHKLNTLTKHLNIQLENHHRACDDAKATAEIFIEMLHILEDRKIPFDHQINLIETTWPKSRRQSHNAILYVTNHKGLKNLYQLVSESNLNYFYRSAGIPKSVLNAHREGLIIGSGNMNGELYKAFLSDCSTKCIDDIAKYYDFFEIQPLSNYLTLIQKGQAASIESIKDINKKIYEIGLRLNKLTVATGDVHYVDKNEYFVRNIILESQGKWREMEKQPQLFLRTTDEMLKEFEYFNEEVAKEIVITNTNTIANMMDDIIPIPEGTYPPVIEGSDKELRKITYDKAESIYGAPLPEYVKSRLDRELNSIIANGYAVLYIIAQKLVWKSNEDGYLVGSRGSVGSSFVATMAGITEVNPLKPHYICSKCKYSEFIDDENIGSGVDLPDKNCPTCGASLQKEGHHIPFEVFLGFEGDKEPDIDLNFAGEYQSSVHKYTEELFGNGKVFRAGTIGTIAETTAYGYIAKYCEKNNLQMTAAEINRLQKMMVGVKRTTGQHPGGVMIVPEDKDITDFCPVQHPADIVDSDIITTHFNYKAISGRILKLDLLGHDVPSIIKMLSDLTNIDPLTIPLDDQETMKIFTSSESLRPIRDYSNKKIGTLGIPEFGTTFVRQMLSDTNPTTFSELVRISGLSHGTNVWLNNAQELIRNQIVELKDVISTRDDIMNYLIDRGLEKKSSFKIMETVRKNKPLDDDTLKYMRESKVPDWYIDSCKKIEYLFPKAHAVAYVLMSYRIAYFKVHYPEAFYATYFTTKIQDYPGDLICRGFESIQLEMERIREEGKEASKKDLNIFQILEVAEEMYARGISSKKVSFENSSALNFKVEEKGFIQPPFRALEGVSDAHAISIYNAHEELRKSGSEFLSIQDLKQKTNINKVALESLRSHGTLHGLYETNQIDLFNLMDS